MDWKVYEVICIIVSTGHAGKARTCIERKTPATSNLASMLLPMTSRSISPLLKWQSRVRSQPHVMLWHLKGSCLYGPCPSRATSIPSRSYAQLWPHCFVIGPPHSHSLPLSTRTAARLVEHQLGHKS